MADESSRPLRDVGRFNSFTDGVMVVSMTLLILNVQLPDTVKNLDGLDLWRELAAIWPHYIGYVVSFLVIAQYWLGYTDYFGRMQGVDDRFAQLNILFLLVVGFIPFATAVLAQNNGKLATSIYAVTMVAVSLLLVAMAFYAIRKGLVERRYPPSEPWREVFPWLQIAAVFTASIAVAQFQPQMAKLVWLLLAAPISIGRRKPSA